MLSNLEWLAQGKQYPPDDRDTKDRFEMYERNRELFDGEAGKVGGIFDNDLKRLRRVVGNYEDIVDFVTLLNYHKLLSLKVADMVVGEKPIFTCEDNKETIEQIEENTLIFQKMYSNVIDISRFGNGVYYVYDDDGKGNFDVSQPRFWIPIVDTMNGKKILNHVMCWVSVNGEKKYLNAQVHYKGYFDNFTYEIMDGNTGELGKIVTDLRGRTLVQTDTSNYTIGRLLESNRVQTGLSDFAIQVTSNVVTSDKITGIDDYGDINSIVCELMVRVGQVSKILDKHSDPSINAPTSSMQQDPETGEWYFKTGNVYPRDSNDDPPVSYITWDAQLEANFKQIEVLLNQLYVLSEMGATLLGGEDKNGTNTSGRALKFKMISPLAKVKRVVMMIDPVIKNVIKLVSSLGGENINDLTNEKINILWMDGLPNDALEEAEIIEKRRASGTLSTEKALIRFDNLSEEEAEEEVAKILDEQAQANPLTPLPFSGNNIPVEDGEDNE